MQSWCGIKEAGSESKIVFVRAAACGASIRSQKNSLIVHRAFRDRFLE
jgi:hypothetical protein